MLGAKRSWTGRRKFALLPYLLFRLPCREQRHALVFGQVLSIESLGILLRPCLTHLWRGHFAPQAFVHPRTMVTIGFPLTLGKLTFMLDQTPGPHMESKTGA